MPCHSQILEELFIFVEFRIGYNFAVWLIICLINIQLAEIHFSVFYKMIINLILNFLISFFCIWISSTSFLRFFRNFVIMRVFKSIFELII